MRAKPFTHLVSRLIAGSCGLALASLLCAPAAFADVAIANMADGTLRLSNATPKVNEPLTVSFTTTAAHTGLSPCWADVVVRGTDSGNNFLQKSPAGTLMVNGSPPRTMSFTLPTPGKYRAFAVSGGTGSMCGGLTAPNLNGSNLQIDFSIAPPPTPIGQIALSTPAAMSPVTAVTISAPGTCPGGYDRLTNGVDTSKGEFYCIKKWQDCPAGYSQSVDNNTGVITCSPTSPPSCPAGWTGGLGEGGKLICNPVPQPVIACGDSPLKAQGYYLQYQKYQNPGWNRMGCYALQQLK